ncbi:MAG: cation transporter [Planctomycetes bacterium]|nr:cation transporter [Planctomycetota bacterium]
MSKRKTEEHCQACARRTCLIGLVGGLAFAFIKMAIGYLGRSRALVASGLCSLSDVSSSLLVMFGVRYAHRPPNRQYPFGYSKLEYIAQLGISAIMLGGAALVFVDAFMGLAKGKEAPPHMIVFFVAIGSAIFNGLMYRYAKCGASHLRSPVLASHATHNKIDVASTLLVAVGVIAARSGMHLVDPVIAIFECLHIIHASGKIVIEAAKGIMDSSLPQEPMLDISRSIADFGQGLTVRNLKARQSGHKAFLDLVIELPGTMNVAEAKDLKKNLASHLKSRHPNLGSIFIQVIPVF